MTTPTWARPRPTSLSAAALMRRTAAIPNQKAAGPSSIPSGQISTTAAMPKMSARAARASTTVGPDAGDVSREDLRATLVRHIPLPRPAVAATATAPTTSKAMNAAGAGLYEPHFNPKAIEAKRSAPSKAPPATNSAPITFTCRTSSPVRHHHRCYQVLRGSSRSNEANWCRGPDLNRRHLDFQSSALPS